ncbi:MAG: hypothetical protein WC858_02970 [Parcubacteria group bacterium]|jgi:hypothetical protein
MSLEQPENFLDTFVDELKKISPEQLRVWIKNERDDQLLKKAADILQTEIGRIPSGQERKELGGKRNIIVERIKANRHIQGNERDVKTPGQRRKNKLNF